MAQDMFSKWDRKLTTKVRRMLKKLLQMVVRAILRKFHMAI